MRDKDIGVLVVLAIAVLFIVTGGKLPTRGNLFSNLGGFTTLSLSSTNVIFNPPSSTLQSGSYWVASVSVNGAGQQLVSSASTQPTQLSANGQTSKDSLTVSMNVNSEQADYRITNQNIFLQKISYNSIFFNPFLPNYGCPSTDANNNQWFFSWKPSFSSNVYCYYISNDASYGEVALLGTSFSGILTITPNGGQPSYTCSINSLQQTNCQFGNVGFVQWSGSLSSQDQAPIPSDQSIAAVYYNGQWRTVDKNLKNSFDVYTSSWSSTCFTQYGNLGIPADSVAQSCLNGWNNFEGSVVAGKNLVDLNTQVVAIPTGTLSNGSMALQLSNAVYFPVMTMYISQAYMPAISIQVNTGMPAITCSGAPVFTTGGNGYITCTVSNVATSGTGSFSIGTTCTSGFIYAGNTAILLQPINAGSSTQVSVPITGTSPGGIISGKCTITVQDRTLSSSYASSTVNVQVNSIIICNANQYRCNGQAIEQCNSAGSGWGTVGALCTDAQYCDSTQNPPICVNKGINGSGGGNACFLGFIGMNCPNPFSNFFSQIGQYTVIILVVIVALFLFSRRGGDSWSSFGVRAV